MNTKATLQGIVVAGAASAKEAVGAPLRAGDVDVLTDSSVPFDDGWIAVRAGLDGLPGGVVVAIGGSDAETLAGAAGGDGAAVLASFLTGVIEAIGTLSGREVTPRPAELVDSDGIEPGSPGASFRLMFEEEGLDARLILDPALAAEVGIEAVGADEQPTVAAAAFPDLGPGAGNGASRDLNVLADVSMTVTVELGRTTLRVRDLLGLAPGSVVELDQPAGTPVAILANGTLVAKGDVVVVDDELGVRITQVVERDAS